jgi:hypothetical protein
MVLKFRCAVIEKLDGKRVAGRVALVALLCLAKATALPAQESGVHYLHQGMMPPGAIGSRQLLRNGSLAGFLQPVEIKAPPGALVSLASEGTFDRPHQVPIHVGLRIGQVYRLRVMNIPLKPGLEVFPTIEIIDRLCAPPDQRRRFAIPIQLSQEDIDLALDGKFVTRVIYLEDPEDALSDRADPDSQRWFEAAPDRDPLAVADALGRPVAILRMGARYPDADRGPDMDFLYGCPPFMLYPPRSAGPRSEHLQGEPW